VAVTTRISEIDTGNWTRPHPMTRAQPLKWFGHDVPENVTHISLMRNYHDFQVYVRWRVRGDEQIHEMPFNQSDEGVMAALVAMKLTC